MFESWEDLTMPGLRAQMTDLPRLSDLFTGMASSVIQARCI